MYNKFFNILDKISYLHDKTTVFNDFIAIFAISISNSCNFNQDKENEYLTIIKKYSKVEIDLLAELSAELITIYENMQNDIQDVLGDIFHQLKIHNEDKGQFFTPFHVSYLMASIVGIEKSKKGYYELNEPCCGAGCMILAYAKYLKENNINYQKEFLAIVQDIDRRCAYMTYIQLSLLGIPAQVTWGNTLTMETFDVLYTPMFVLGNWISKVNK